MEDARDTLFTETKPENKSSGNTIVYNLSNIKETLDDVLTDALIEAGAGTTWFRCERYSENNLFPIRIFNKIIRMERPGQIHLFLVTEFKTSKESICGGSK